MPQFEVTYFVGYDRDDWNKIELTASDREEARIKAIDTIPRDCRIKKLEEIQKPNTMEQTKIQNITPQGT